MAKKPITIRSVDDLKHLTPEERRDKSRPLVFDFNRQLGETDEEWEARMRAVTEWLMETS